MLALPEECPQSPAVRPLQLHLSGISFEFDRLLLPQAGASNIRVNSKQRRLFQNKKKTIMSFLR